VFASLVDTCDTSIIDTVMYMVNNTGNNSTCAMKVTNSATPVVVTKNVTKVNQSAALGGPTSGRAMKAGVEMVCVSPPLTAQGRVHVLNCDSRLFLAQKPSTATQAEWGAFQANVVADPRCRHYSANEFLNRRLFYSHPRNQVDYEDWFGWSGTFNADQFAPSFLDWPNWTPSSFPLSSIIIIFDPTPSGAITYSLTSLMHFYTRWDSGNVMSTTQRCMLSQPQAKFESSAQQAKAIGAVGVTTTEGPTILQSALTGMHAAATEVAGRVGQAAVHAAAGGFVRGKLNARTRQREAAIMYGGGVG
jgi:hypothetical protein